MANISLTYDEKAEIARMVADLLRQEKAQAAPPDYVPTKRLSRQDAAKHLGISVRTLDNRVSAGTVRKHKEDGQDPYFLLGELDRLRTPEVGAMRAGKTRAYNKKQRAV